MARRADYQDAWAQAWKAIRDGDDVLLRRVLADRPDLASNGMTITLMDDAAGIGRASAIAVLLDAGFPADEADGNGATPLMEAAWRGHFEAVRLLLEAGADPDTAAEEDGSYGDPRASGRCALWGAVLHGYREVINLLEPLTSPEMRQRAYEAAALRHDQDFEDALPYPEETLWMLLAARRGDLDALSAAIEDGGDVNLMLRPEESHSVFGSTPLSFAAARGRLDLVEALLQAGADPKLKDHLGRTAADLAAAGGHTAIAAWLRAYGD